MALSFHEFSLAIFTILEEHFGPSQVVGNENNGICIVLKSDQWKLVTTSDPLKAIVIPMGEALRVTIHAFGVTVTSH